MLKNWPHEQEWVWYQQHIVDYIHQDMGLAHRFPTHTIQRAIGTPLISRWYSAQMFSSVYCTKYVMWSFSVVP
jgi:hypothetical protein